MIRLTLEQCSKIAADALDGIAGYKPKDTSPPKQLPEQSGVGPPMAGMNRGMAGRPLRGLGQTANPYMRTTQTATPFARTTDRNMAMAAANANQKNEMAADPGGQQGPSFPAQLPPANAPLNAMAQQPGPSTINNPQAIPGSSPGAPQPGKIAAAYAQYASHTSGRLQDDKRGRKSAAGMMPGPQAGMPSPQGPAAMAPGGPQSPPAGVSPAADPSMGGGAPPMDPSAGGAPPPGGDPSAGGPPPPGTPPPDPTGQVGPPPPPPTGILPPNPPADPGVAVMDPMMGQQPGLDPGTYGTADGLLGQAHGMGTDDGDLLSRYGNTVSASDRFVYRKQAAGNPFNEMFNDAMDSKPTANPFEMAGGDGQMMGPPAPMGQTSGAMGGAMASNASTSMPGSAGMSMSSPSMGAMSKMPTTQPMTSTTPMKMPMPGGAGMAKLSRAVKQAEAAGVSLASYLRKTAPVGIGAVARSKGHLPLGKLPVSR